MKIIYFILIFLLISCASKTDLNSLDQSRVPSSRKVKAISCKTSIEELFSYKDKSKREMKAFLKTKKLEKRPKKLITGLANRYAGDTELEYLAKELSRSKPGLHSIKLKGTKLFEVETIQNDNVLTFRLKSIVLDSLSYQETSDGSVVFSRAMYLIMRYLYHANVAIRPDKIYIEGWNVVNIELAQMLNVLGFKFDGTEGHDLSRIDFKNLYTGVLESLHNERGIFTLGDGSTSVYTPTEESEELIKLIKDNTLYLELTD